MARHLQDATGTSIKKIVQNLRTARSATIEINGQRLTLAPELTETARAILSRLESGHQAIGTSQVCVADAGRVLVGVEFAAHGEAGLCGGGGDEVDDDLVGLQWSPAPVSGDLGEAVFRLVPFRGAGRQVGNVDLQTGLGGEGGELDLPGADP